jgi:hypothetical protein
LPDNYGSCSVFIFKICIVVYIFFGSGYLRVLGIHIGIGTGSFLAAACRQCFVFTIVGDPDPFIRGMDLDPSFPFLSGLKDCLQNKILTQSFTKKLNF